MKTIILSDKQYASLQTALSYAAEQRLYEANQTVDDLDCVQIEASAHEWSKLQDALQVGAEDTEDIKVVVCMFKGVVDDVLANVPIKTVEIVHAEELGCDGLQQVCNRPEIFGLQSVPHFISGGDDDEM